MFKKSRKGLVFQDVNGYEVHLFLDTISFFINRGSYVDVHTTGGMVSLIITIDELYDCIR